MVLYRIKVVLSLQVHNMDTPREMVASMLLGALTGGDYTGSRLSFLPLLMLQVQGSILDLPVQRPHQPTHILLPY